MADNEKTRGNANLSFFLKKEEKNLTKRKQAVIIPSGAQNHKWECLQIGVEALQLPQLPRMDDALNEKTEVSAEWPPGLKFLCAVTTGLYFKKKEGKKR